MSFLDLVSRIWNTPRQSEQETQNVLIFLKYDKNRPQ